VRGSRAQVRAVVLATLASSCASAPVFRDTQIEYPPPAGQTCGRSETTVRISVQDTQGGAFARVPVRLIPVEDLGTVSPAPVSSAMTDESGTATLVIPGDRSWAATVVVAGIIPETRPINFAQGCSGTVVFKLHIATDEQLKARGYRPREAAER
jgi:hypothetical protein